MHDDMAPFEPPLLTHELPMVGGHLGPEPEHFQVDEVLLHEPSGAGEHLFVRIEKRLFTTPDAVDVIARAARVRSHDIGYAGMKDRHAVTRQWISLPARSSAVESWQLPEGLRVLEVQHNTQKLRTGQLRGNHFTVRLVDVPPGGAERAAPITAALLARGLPNYFGGQRFGRGGMNLSRAVHWLRTGAKLYGRRARFYAKLYPSVIQSELFNRYTAARMALGFERLLRGEVLRLANVNSVFVVEHPEQELPRLLRRDVVLTGPMLGPKARLIRDEAEALVKEAFAGLGLPEELVYGWGRLGAGTHRDLLVIPEGLSVQATGERELELRFFLPAGSYATELLRELCRGPFLEPHLRAQEGSEEQSETSAELSAPESDD
jgi:tRNA pseudouridine13 synthase